MITDTKTNLDIFVHHTNIISQGWRVLEPRETVEYRVVKTRRGYEALDVISLGPSGFKPVTGYTEKHGGVHARVIYDAEMLKSGTKLVHTLGNNFEVTVNHQPKSFQKQCNFSGSLFSQSETIFYENTAASY